MSDNMNADVGNKTRRKRVPDADETMSDFPNQRMTRFLRNERRRRQKREEIKQDIERRHSIRQIATILKHNYLLHSDMNESLVSEINDDRFNADLVAVPTLQVSLKNLSAKDAKVEKKIWKRWLQYGHDLEAIIHPSSDTAEEREELIEDLSKILRSRRRFKLPQKKHHNADHFLESEPKIPESIDDSDVVSELLLESVAHNEIELEVNDRKSKQPKSQVLFLAEDGKTLLTEELIPANSVQGQLYLKLGGEQAFNTWSTTSLLPNSNRLKDADVQGHIFDVDGTLVDTMPMLYKCLSAAFKAVNITPYSEERFYGRAGVSSPDVVQLLHYEQFNQTLPSQNTVNTFRAVLKNEIMQYLDKHQISPIQSVVNIARKAHAEGVPIAIATSGHRVTLKRVLKSAGIDTLFHDNHIVTKYDLEPGRGKPYPDIFIKAANSIGVPPSKCRAYEDGAAGMVAADEAGLEVVDVRTFPGYPWQKAQKQVFFDEQAKKLWAIAEMSRQLEAREAKRKEEVKQERLKQQLTHYYEEELKDTDDVNDISPLSHQVISDAVASIETGFHGIKLSHQLQKLREEGKLLGSRKQNAPLLEQRQMSRDEHFVLTNKKSDKTDGNTFEIIDEEWHEDKDGNLTKMLRIRKPFYVDFPTLKSSGFLIHSNQRKSRPLSVATDFEQEGSDSDDKFSHFSDDDEHDPRLDMLTPFNEEAAVQKLNKAEEKGGRIRGREVDMRRKKESLTTFSIPREELPKYSIEHDVFAYSHMPVPFPANLLSICLLLLSATAAIIMSGYQPLSCHARFKARRN